MPLDPLGQLNPYVIVATLTIVAVTYVVLRRWLFEPYIVVLDERQQLIDVGRERLAEAEAITRQAAHDVSIIEADARAKVEAIQHEAVEEAEALRKRAMDQAIKDVDDLLAGRRAEIAQAREVETARVRTQAVDCVGLACSQLFGQADSLIVESSVDRALDRLG